MKNSKRTIKLKTIKVQSFVVSSARELQNAKHLRWATGYTWVDE